MEVIFFFYEEGFSVTRKRAGQGAPIAVTSAPVWPSCPHKEGIVVDGPSQTKSRLCFGGGGIFVLFVEVELCWRWSSILKWIQLGTMRKIRAFCCCRSSGELRF